MQNNNRRFERKKARIRYLSIHSEVMMRFAHSPSMAAKAVIANWTQANEAGEINRASVNMQNGRLLSSEFITP